MSEAGGPERRPGWEGGSFRSWGGRGSRLAVPALVWPLSTRRDWERRSLSRG